MAVLTGDEATAGGKVLKTDKNTKLFVNFSDHGAPGLIAFPSDYLFADELQSTINTMEEKGMFGEMVFYLEACESGSMFPSLTADQNVYAVTASNATQSSYAAYCGRPYDVVDGVSIGSCLGDEFSVNWMEDSEASNPFLETLDEQFEIVKAKTTGSPVQKFGDFDFVDEPIGNFEGSNIAKPSFIQHSLKLIKNMKVRKEITKSTDKGLVNSRDVNAFVLFQQVEEKGDSDSFVELMEELKHRKREDEVFASVFAEH